MRSFVVALALAGLSLPLMAAPAETQAAASAPVASPVTTTSSSLNCPVANATVSGQADEILAPIELTMKISRGRRLVSASELVLIPNGAATPLAVTRDVAYVDSLTPDATGAVQPNLGHVTEGYSALFRVVPLGNTPRMLVAYQVNLSNLEALNTVASETYPDQYIQLPQLNVHDTCGAVMLKEGQVLDLTGFTQETPAHGWFSFFASRRATTTIQISWKKVTMDKTASPSSAAP